jgi:hypothetical protein
MDNTIKVKPNKKNSASAARLQGLSRRLMFKLHIKRTKLLESDIDKIQATMKKQILTFVKFSLFWNSFCHIALILDSKATLSGCSFSHWRMKCSTFSSAATHSRHVGLVSFLKSRVNDHWCTQLTTLAELYKELQYLSNHNLSKCKIHPILKHRCYSSLDISRIPVKLRQTLESGCAGWVFLGRFHLDRIVH